MFEAVIFDFDGLIVDTETPLYEAWSETFAEFGVEPISITEWAHSLGRGDDDPELLDPSIRLHEACGGWVTMEAIQAARRARRDVLLADQPVMAGVVDLLDEADRHGLRAGVASSSPFDWVEPHLRRRDLRERFAALSCAGAGVPGKPDPAVYLAACAALDADPTRSIAFEDSPHGVTAAKSAGMTCVAVPTVLGRSLDFSHADHVIRSLSDVSLSGLAG